MDLKQGMYVRVSVDYEDDINPRMFATGQVESIDEFGNVTVIFYKNYIKNEYEFVPNRKVYTADKVKRCKILKNTNAINIFERVKVISFSKKEDDYSNYYVESSRGIREVSEADLMVDFIRGNVNPMEQMISYEFHNPYWYGQRQLPSEVLNILNNIDNNFSTLISSRAYLFEHQIDTIVRALREENCRLMFADEVGLGKTIEALVVLKGLNLKKALIIAPRALVNQWKNEIDIKLWMDSRIYNGKNLKGQGILIVPTEEINNSLTSQLMENYDFCIIDEVHKIVNTNQYNLIYKLCESLSRVILLSATPIQERNEEYLKLLKLLKPNIYKNMTESKFLELYNKSAVIRTNIYNAYRDLEEILISDEDEVVEIIEDIVEYLEEISEEVNDSKFAKILASIDSEEIEDSKNKIKESLAYVSENYQFEKNIIRHRRAEISNILPKRDLSLVSYDMMAGDLNVYEYNCYEELLLYIEKFSTKTRIKVAYDYVIVLLNSFFSSAYSFKEVLSLRKKSLSRINKTVNNIDFDYRTLMEVTIKNAPTMPKEDIYLDKLIALARKWEVATENEIKNIDKSLENPDNIKTRFGFLADYMDQELYDSKVVIFTSYRESLAKLKDMISNMWGEDSVVIFSSDINTDVLEENVAKFQKNKKCRVMICDETGGEGRNFQIADSVIHFDLPFSPTVLEQRIGRLDRIGRDKENIVNSVVLTTNDTIENDLLNIWNDCLNIFNESLSGLEIALEDIKSYIENAIVQDSRYGLNNSFEDINKFVDNIKSAVEQERYYDMARQLDYSTKERYNEIIEKFDNQGGEFLAKAMIRWGKAAGFEPEFLFEEKIAKFTARSIKDKCLKNSMFAIPDTSEAVKRGKVHGEIIGTFERGLAVKTEDAVFFGPGESIFDSIMNNVQEGFRGRAAAVIVKDADTKFDGFIFKWNMNFNINKLIENNIDPSFVKYSYGHMPVTQFTSYITVDNDGFDRAEVAKFLENVDFKNKHTIKHIGKRDNNLIDSFKKVNSEKAWKKVVESRYKQAVEDVKLQYNNKIDVKKIKEDMSFILAGAKVSANYYNKDEDVNKFKSSLIKVMEGILTPERTLDSIIYVRLDKKND